MASIGKVTASALSGTQEFALALANLNFDFSLVKLEAPPEFHALGASLSKSRRQAAEYGRTHVTARKLGALFDQTLPRTPRLVEVYGKRASELAGSKKTNPQATAKDGIFSDFTGADGTSIWAAATSGSGAISVHLLACMLARIWTAAEATSIWVEIVEARKKELQKTVDYEPLGLPTLLAAQVVLEREQLAEWDNSARAWLRRADEGKKREQTQLMLILNNLSIPVNSKLDTYSSVMLALKTALLAIEELLEGRPQGVQDGSLLLALSCWHIYPDLIVLRNRTVKQSDKLVPEDGKLTIGLESSPSLKTTGVRWSLSLAHMRYYGPAITSERSLGAASARLTIDQLWLVALGSILENWDYKALDSLQSSSVMLSINKCLLTQSTRKSSFPLSKKKSVKNQPIGLRQLDGDWKTNFYSAPNWVRGLSDAASSLHNARAPNQEFQSRLVALGRGSGASFLAQKGSYPPAVFGLSDFEGFVGTLETDEDRIAIYGNMQLASFPMHRLERPGSQRRERWREFNSKEAEPLGDQVRHTKRPRDGQSTEEPPTKKARSDIGEHTEPETGIENQETISDDQPSPDLEHNKKSPDGSQNDKSPRIPAFSIQGVEESKLQPANPRTIPYEYATALPIPTIKSSFLATKAYYHYRWFDPRNMPLPLPTQSIFDPVKTREVVLLKSQDMFGLDPAIKEQLKEKVQDANSEENETIVEDIVDPTFTLKNPRTFEVYDTESVQHGTETRPTEYEFFIGDPEIAAIYVSKDLHEAYKTEARMPYWATKKKRRKKRVDIDDIRIALDSGAISAQSLDATLRHEDRFHYTTSLLALAAIQETYEELHGATIDPNIILRPLHTVTCLDGFSGSYMGVGYQTKSLPRERAFACIALLETGTLNLSVNHFQNVIAIASADSLYVASQLLLDPAEPETPQKVRRIVGNVGRPGVSLLVPPAESQTLKAQPESWRLINRTSYDGVQTDSFSDTSLHLSLTGWSTTVDTGPAAQGKRDVEAALIEAVVSVHNRGKWIADIDVLTALKKGHSQFDHEFYFICCPHNSSLNDVDASVPLSPVSVAPTTAPGISVDSPTSTHFNAKIAPAEYAELIKGISLTTVDSWEEFLDRPSGPCVVRAHQNCLARLATGVLGVYRGDRVLVGDKVCWRCYAELDNLGGEDIVARITFIT